MLRLMKLGARGVALAARIITALLIGATIGAVLAAAIQDYGR